MLDAIYQREVFKLQGEYEWFKKLNISEKWKAMFFDIGVTRGFRYIREFKDMLIAISENDTEVVSLFCEKKMVGIEKLYHIATKMTPKCQVIYYEAVNLHGVKSPAAIIVWENCFNGIEPKTLFDFEGE